MAQFQLSNFYKKSLIFVTLSILGAILNYLLYPVVAHILSTAQFGDFTALSALSNQILGVLLAFNVISIYLVKTNHESEAREKSQAILKVLVWLLVVLATCTLLLSPILKSRLQILESGSFIMVVLILLVSLPAIIWNGYLQGHKETAKVGLFAFSSAFFKLLFAATLVGFFGVTGGLAGIALGLVMGLIVLFVSSKRELPKLRTVFSKLEKSEFLFLRSIRLYVLEAILVVGGLGFLQNVDILFAKSFFSPQVAGAYSGISILSNAVYYICFLLVWILLPELDPKNPAHNRQILKTAYKYLAVIGATAVVSELILGRILTKLLLGEKFLNLSGLLVTATLFQISLVAVTIYAYYLLVLRKRKSIILAASVVLPALILPFFFHSTPRSLILSLLGCVLLGFVIFVFLTKVLDNRRSYVSTNP